MVHTDQGLTPYLAVQVDQRTRVPREYVREGQIVLNLGMEATHQLSISNELITFQARFNGVAQHLSIPVGNVTAIYARENGQGMAFDVTLQNEDAVSLVESSEPTRVSSIDDRNVMDTEPSEPSPCKEACETDHD